MSDEIIFLDARALRCPLPLLRTKKMLSELQEGEKLQVVTRDPASVKDFQAFTKQTGHLLLSQDEREGEYYFLLQKKTTP